MTRMISEHNAETGETIVREATLEELAQWEKDKVIFAAEKQVFEANKAKREAALAKLAALGLEPDDLKALGL